MLTDEQRTLVREKLVSLAFEHERRIARLTKDYEAERKRLSLMLRTGVVAQTPTA